MTTIVDNGDGSSTISWTDVVDPPTESQYRIVWNNVGERSYETGVDRGVLYVDGQSGVAWNGLISVSESPAGGDATPYYIDGIKYLNRSTVQEYVATLEALSSPKEFDACDGMVDLYPGFFVTNQRRKSFGLSYRTKIGNDVDGIEHGYKIHLVYNALAAPTEQSNTTIKDSPEPITFSWEITTTPNLLSGYCPTAHFVIDSRTIDSAILEFIEDSLYGSDAYPSKLLSFEEIIAIFTDVVIQVPFEAILISDDVYTVSGVLVISDNDGNFTMDDPSITSIGDDIFMTGSEQVLEILITGPKSYLAEGTAVTIVSSEIFAMDSTSVVDNGDGSLTVL